MAEQFAIVTGASSGIGFSLAKELASRGYDLAVCSAGERLPNATEELRSQGIEVTEVQADLATQDGVKQFWDQVISLGRNVDVACINAGVGVGEPMEKQCEPQKYASHEALLEVKDTRLLLPSTYPGHLGAAVGRYQRRRRRLPDIPSGLMR